jgi:Photosynthetic reaction centre cytochrome C subunit
MMPRLLRSVVSAGQALALAAALTAVAFAQAPQAPAAPAAFQNLQVLPKDISRRDLGATMRGFETALGVECTYCHVREGRGGRNDMASDEKPPKQTARVMMRMVRQINETLAANLKKPAADIEQVQCATCHRGSAIPKVDEPAPREAAR